MDKKLFHVKVDLYVLAEDEWEARVAATQAKFDIFECQARKVENVIPGWENAVPYNSRDDRTCQQILSEKAGKDGAPAPKH